MEAQDPLSELADIHLPQAVSFWPPAPGWWILAALLLAALLCGVRLGLLALARYRRRNAALGELDAALRRYREQAALEARSNQAGLNYLNRVNNVLRRVALIRFPGQPAASLYGNDWLGFLDGCDGGREFRDGPGRPLGEGPYRPAFQGDPDALHAAARRWIDRRYGEQHLLPRPWRRPREARA